MSDEKTSTEKILYRVQKINADFIENLDLSERATIVNMLGQLIAAQAAEQQKANQARQEQAQAAMVAKMEEAEREKRFGIVPPN